MDKEIKYNGYTATPSDYESPDGDLVGIINGVPEDGEVKPILPPTVKFALNTGEKVLWIHKMTGHTHYIIMVTTTVNNVTTQSLKWVCEEEGAPWTRHDITGGTVTGTTIVSSIGNTLIVNDDDGVKYFLWSTESTAHYEALGQKPPMLEITFGLHSDFAVWPETKNEGDTYQSEYKGTIIEFGAIKEPVVPHLEDDDVYLSAWAAPKPEMEQDSGPRLKFAEDYATYTIEGMTGATDEEKESITTIKVRLAQEIFAKVNYFVNQKGTNENKFVMPFFIRYAYRLYDDSYIMHSYPVLMIPNSRGPIFALDGVRGLCLNDNNNDYVEMKIRGRVYGCLSELVYSISTIPADLNKWKDLITSVDIGVSAPIYAYDQSGEVLGWTNMDGAHDWEPYYTVSKVMKLGDKTVGSPSWGATSIQDVFKSFETATRHQGDSYGDYFNRYSSDYKYPNYLATIPLRKSVEINKTLTGATNFYIIKQFTIDELSTCSEQELELEDGVLGGLVARKTLDDDYHSHDILHAKMMYGYNGRMNYSGIERVPHSPLNPVVQFTQASAVGQSGVWQIRESLKHETQTYVVESVMGSNNTYFPHWIFYPDVNAKYAYVSKTSGSTTTTYKLKLTPHDFLNGAYWLGDFANVDATPSETMSGSVPSPSTGGIKEANKIYTSEVNNPFSVTATGITTVGTGEIMAICSATKALSQGQFGQFPLYAFTTEGVWALETSSTGTFVARQPVTRDVCTNAESITQLDDSVLFATDRGIMLLSGSTTLCITDEINNTTPIDLGLPAGVATLSGITMPTIAKFVDYLKGARMTYDYTGQRVIVFNPTATAYSYAYVFSLKDKKWGMMESTLSYPINSYPEALAVTKDNKLVNLSQDVNSNASAGDDVQTVNVLLVTRPLKLDQGDVLKTVREVMQRGKFDHLQTGRTPKPVRSLLMGSVDLYHWHLVWSSQDHRMGGFSGSPYKYFRIVVLGSLAPDESLFGCTVRYEPKMTNKIR